MFYLVWDTLLDSDCALPSLLAANLPNRADSSQQECPWTVRLLTIPEAWMEEPTWIRHEYRWDGTPWLSVARKEKTYLLRFPQMADFLLASERRTITCIPAEGNSWETVEHLLLDHVLPMSFSVAGRLILHASAIETPQGVIAFAGVSGQGKSTLATYLTRCGYPLLTDDCLLLEERDGQFYAWPSYPGTRLWDDSRMALDLNNHPTSPVAHYSFKKRISLNQGAMCFATGPAPLRRIYLLGTQEEEQEEEDVLDTVQIQPLTPREALFALMKATFTLDIAAPSRLREAFETSGRLVNQCSCAHLKYPRDYTRLEEVRRAILEDLAE